MNKLIKKTTIGVIGLVMVLSMVSVVTITDRAEAADPTVTELLVIIATLNETIARLNATIDEFHADRAIVPDAWCHDFRRNLRIGDRGAEVRALQTALEKENFDINAAEQNVARFGPHTAAAVVGFQEKYKQAVLARWNLVRGTGFVGPTTRVKLNELFGCKGIPIPVRRRPVITYISPSQGRQGTDVLNIIIKGRNFKGAGDLTLCGIFPVLDHGFRVISCREVSDTEIEAQFSIVSAATLGPRNITVRMIEGRSNAVAFRVIEKERKIAPSITVISPNGGERFVQGANYTIRWTSREVAELVRITICMTPESYTRAVRGETRCDIGVITNNDGSYSGQFGRAATVGNYTARIEDATDTTVYDESDNYFSIVELSQIEPSEEKIRFEDFPILERFEGAPALVDLLSHPRAMEFKTELVEGAKKGPNFAGHYTVITWGCGTMCQVVVIVDAKTGIVYFPPFGTELGSDFRLNSNLFIVNPPEAIKRTFANYSIPDWVYTAYYKWENNQFISIYDTRNPYWKTYGWEACTAEKPCAVGQGDCDTDADCLPGFICAQNVGAKYGQASSMDVCEKQEERWLRVLDYQFDVNNDGTDEFFVIEKSREEAPPHKRAYDVVALFEDREKLIEVWRKQVVLWKPPIEAIRVTAGDLDGNGISEILISIMGAPGHEPIGWLYEYNKKEVKLERFTEIARTIMGRKSRDIEGFWLWSFKEIGDYNRDGVNEILVDVTRLINGGIPRPGLIISISWEEIK